MTLRWTERAMGDVVSDIPQLARDFPVSYAIFAMARTHRAIAAAKLAELGLYPNQELVLVQLGTEDGMPQRDLARALRVSHVTIVKMIARMERAGLVERRSSETDRRLSLVFLTDAGRALSTQVLGIWAQLEAITAGQLTSDVQQGFLAGTGTIRAALDAAAGDATQPA